MLKSGIIRRMDDLGRIVIPKEVRRGLRIKENDPLEIVPTNDSIIITKYSAESDVIGILTELRGLVENSFGDSGQGAMIQKIQELASLVAAEIKRKDKEE